MDRKGIRLLTNLSHSYCVSSFQIGDTYLNILKLSHIVAFIDNRVYNKFWKVRILQAKDIKKIKTENKKI